VQGRVTKWKNDREHWKSDEVKKPHFFC
jgi:hypothetical protein